MIIRLRPTGTCADSRIGRAQCAKYGRHYSALRIRGHNLNPIDKRLVNYTIPFC